ncbi:MAG TPA: hypothetical protein VME47_10865 [Acetobacteraceae bacterium]|nr:hypothetical protein [Acetobacteraceae bacterium]
MKQISFSIRRDVRLGSIVADQQVDVYDALERRDQINRMMRRRLSDELESLIRRACQRGHLGTAEELLMVLRNLVDWEKEHFPHGRRPIDDMIERVAAELNAAKAQRDAA